MPPLVVTRPPPPFRRSHSAGCAGVPRVQAGLEVRPSACEQAQLASGIAARLVAAVPQAADAATATELKEALRAAWWRAGHDAMHGVRAPDTTTT